MTVTGLIIQNQKCRWVKEKQELPESRRDKEAKRHGETGIKAKWVSYRMFHNSLQLFSVRVHVQGIMRQAALDKALKK